MRLPTILAAAFVAAVLCAASAAGDASVVAERDGGMTVRVTLASPQLATLELPGSPALRYERFFVAVPEGADVRVRRVGGSFTDEPASLPELRDVEGTVGERAPLSPGFYPAQPVVVSEPMVLRRTRVVAVDCYASQVDYEAGIHRRWSDYDVTVDFSGRGAGAVSADPVLSSIVVNPADQAPAGRNLRASQVPDPHFSLSPNWVKIRVRTPGVYSITGTELAATGVNLSSIGNPTSFRLFTGGGQEQSPNLNDIGSWMTDEWMSECDIVVEYGGDGSFDPGDRLIFYGLGSRGFRDLYEPGAPRERFHDHRFATENVYYLTWDSSFTGQPARMASVAAAPTANPDLTTYEKRLYFEENRVDDYSFGGDGWLWLEVPEIGPSSYFLSSFPVQDLDTGQPQTLRTVALAKVTTNNLNHHARYLFNNSLAAEQVWNTGGGHRFNQGVPVIATGTFLQEGNNTFTLNVPRDLNPKDHMYFAWYSIFYHRQIKALNNALFFSSPDTIGSVDYDVVGFTNSDPRYVFDVSDPYHPVRLTGGTETAAGVTFSSVVGANRRAYYWTSTAAGFLQPAGVLRYFPTDLRAVTESPHMIIVTDESLLASAQILRQHRLQNLPLFASPRVSVVTMTDIFDNFSGGQNDPMALRNYCKFLYDNYSEPGGGPSLTYVLFLGDANVDYKKNKNQQKDFVTTNLNLNPVALDAFATDDYYALLDVGDLPGAGAMDIAIGRLPAGSISEAEQLVRKVIDYEREAEFGDWRNRVILVADDENSATSTTQNNFVLLSELLAHNILADYIEAKKLYLTEFPLIGSIKPGSRLQFVNDWNDGAAVINYVGHGSTVQMADEQVFLDKDVGLLSNGLRLPLFMAFSCTIGNFTTESKSLSERLLLWETGGVIATLTASELTYIGPNDRLDEFMMRNLFPSSPGTPLPLGLVVTAAKLGALNSAPGSTTVEENNQKYNLLSDPALRLHSPQRSVELVPTDIDTLTTGKRMTVRGRVLDAGGQTDTAFSGQVKLLVRETDDESGYAKEGFSIAYRYPGGTVYRGTANVMGGWFQFSFSVPRFAKTGNKGFVLAYANNDSGDAVGKNYSVVLRAPSAGDPNAVPVDGPPRIDLGFERGQRIVKPGAVLQAAVNDADGINVLGTTPEGKLALVFDETELPLDVTQFFEFEHGGIDTSGAMVFPLPDLAVGEHRVVFKVSDSFGQTSLDTLSFTMTDALDYAAEVVMNYPNPFEDVTHFLISLTDPATIRLELFTLSGKRVRTLNATAGAGDRWITWDGRDNFGGSVANGTYLYVARVEFTGLDRSPVVLRGKVVRIN